MKTVSKIIYVLCIIINSSCEDISDFDPGESKPVVEAFLYEGESVDDIYLKKTSPLNTPTKSDPEIISDAIITISSDGQDFILSPLKGHPGRYAYDGNDLSVNIGNEYFLTFEYEDIIILYVPASNAWVTEASLPVLAERTHSVALETHPSVI